ncbi:MAG: nucleotide sugar dehydrogenase [Janthinobacterium lividum]
MRKVDKILVVGLGYVGAPLALALSRHFDVCGVDVDATRVSDLLAGHDRTGELPTEALLHARWHLTERAADAIAQADVIIVTVPTPVTDANVPDLSLLIQATRTISDHMKTGTTVVYESTVYPGVTEQLCVPILSRCRAGPGRTTREHRREYWVAYSPERINPGDGTHTITNTTKVVAGDTPETLDLVERIYSRITHTYRAPSIKVAEAAKVIENTQRDVNIALMNEFSHICARLDIDTHDVIEAAGSKWNFHKYVPGFVGGHCIAVDPYYLTYRSTQLGHIPSLILTARDINDEMPVLTAQKTVKAMHRCGLPADAQVTVLGIAFKENVRDIRNSKTVELIREFESWGLAVQVIDPLADPDAVRREHGIELTPPDACEKANALVLAVPHDAFMRGGWSGILAHAQRERIVVVTDVKGVLSRADIPHDVRLIRP